MQVYCLDLGSALTPVADLPNVGAVATRAEPDLLRRTVRQLTGLLHDRERRFAAHPMDSPVDWRARWLAGRPLDDRYGDVVLVVDGWAVLRAEFDDLEARRTQ